MWLMHAVVVITISLACLSGCSRTSQGFVFSMCMQPTGAAVKDSHQAILLARAAWYCGHPLDHERSESEWLAEYEAYNKDDTWEVAVKVPEGFAGGGPVVDIDARNGRILDMNRTQ
jgi:hypothetical protein